MGINNISLSPELLGILYPDSLVPDRQPPPATKPYPFLGSNLRRICFLVFYPDSVFLPDDQLQFLTKILGACHCSVADIAVLNLARTPADLQGLTDRLNPEILFICGISAGMAGLPVLSTAFSPRDLGSMTAIGIPPLEEINQETPSGTALKKQLWASLKKLFAL